jgi:very-short-patch-repair endonuclease
MKLLLVLERVDDNCTNKNPTRKLIIECDGGQHAEQTEKDGKRDSWFKTQGFEVLRFWDHDVLQNTEAVLETIWTACRRGPPSP